MIFRLSVTKYPKRDAEITNLLMAFNFSELDIFSLGHTLVMYFLLNKIVGSFNQNGVDGVDGICSIIYIFLIIFYYFYSLHFISFTSWICSSFIYIKIKINDVYK